MVAVARACKNEQLQGHCGCSNAGRPEGLDTDWVSTASADILTAKRGCFNSSCRSKRTVAFYVSTGFLAKLLADGTSTNALILLFSF